MVIWLLETGLKKSGLVCFLDILFRGVGVEFDNKIILYSFSEEKFLQGCPRTLLSNINCLKNIYTGLKGASI